MKLSDDDFMRLEMRISQAQHKIKLLNFTIAAVAGIAVCIISLLVLLNTL